MWNQLNKLNKQNRDRLKREWADSSLAGEWGDGTEQKGKRIHGHGQQHGNYNRLEGIRGINGNGKIQLKIKILDFKKASESLCAFILPTTKQKY